MAEAVRAAAETALRRRLVTPEGVDLGLTLAGVGQRLAALLLDLLIMLAMLIVGTILAVLLARGAGESRAWMISLVWLLGAFLLRNAYFILLELGPRAATFGKRVAGIRVVARNGGRLTSDAVIARNLMREVELFLPLTFLMLAHSQGSELGLLGLFGLGWTAIFLFFPLFNRDRLRVGDLLAGTWVIHAPARELGVDLLREFDTADQYSFTDEQLDAYGTFELQTLERVLRDGHPEALAAVASAIRKRIGYGEEGDDYFFLSLYYQALRTRLERGMLFGRRRADKNDR